MATIYDHLGNPYTSKRARAEAYGKNYQVVDKDLAKGLSLEEALTRNYTYKRKPIEGPDGKTYESISALASHYGINPNSLNNALRRGNSLEIAIKRLQNRRNPSPVKDRLRKEGIPRNLYIHFKRKHKGLTLDEIIEALKAQFAYDHLGYAYRNERDMARAWELVPNTFMHRFHKVGWSLEDALSIRYQGDSERLEKPKPQMLNRYSLFRRTKKTVA